MSRIELGGFGTRMTAEDPIEQLDPDTDFRFPLTYTLADGVIFKAADFADIGYTNFEAVCIGAAGGMGANAVRTIGLTSSVIAFGGASGGGGLHVVSGLLADLPDELVIAVGRCGQAGTYGDNTSPYIAVRAGSEHELLNFDTGHGHNPPYSNAGIPIAPYVSPDYAPGEVAHGQVYYPNPYLGATQDGKDGGASKFGEVAMASGGKGGHRAIFSGPNADGGFGGDGGVGGSDVAGGGAGHGIYDEGLNGTWDGTIGQGGAGGRSEIAGQVAYDSGRGSYNPADTSRYGPHEIVDVYDPVYRSLAGTGGGATTQRRAFGSVFGGGTTTDGYQRMHRDAPFHGDTYADFNYYSNVTVLNSPHGIVTVHLTQDI